MTTFSTITMPRTLDAPLIDETQTQSIRYVASHRASAGQAFKRNAKAFVSAFGASLIEILNAAPPLRLPRVSLRIIAVMLLFFSAAASLTVGLIVLSWSGIDVIRAAGPLALIAAGGAAFSAMIIAINSREDSYDE
jgi:hypothetical protein